MNDDFLRQPTPPVRAEFATQLKKKLDRQPEPTRTAGLRMALMEMFTMITSTRIRRAGFTLAAAVLAGAAILAVSPQAQAAARDFLIRVAGMSFSTAPAPAVAPPEGLTALTPPAGTLIGIPSGEKGAPGVVVLESSAVISGVNSVTTGGGQAVAGSVESVSAAQLARDVNFKLPTRLPAGTDPGGQGFVLSSPSGQRHATVMWLDGHSHLSLTYHEGGADKFTFDVPGAKVSEVKLKDKTLAVIEFASKDGFFSYSANSADSGFGMTTVSGDPAGPGPTPIMVQWKDGNNLYVLSSFSGALTRDQLIDVAASVP